MSFEKNLDRKSELVFEAIYELGGEANTSEIKDYTGIEKNGIISYRYDKLKDAGLIETRKVDTGETLPVTIAEITEKGEENVGTILEDGQPTLTERVANLRDIVADAHSKVERFDGRVDHFEQRIDEEMVEQKSVEEAIEGLEDDVEHLNSRIDSVHDTLTERIKRLEFWQRDVVEALYYNGLIDVQIDDETDRMFVPGADQEANLDRDLARPGPVLEWMVDEHDDEKGTETRRQRL